jgi:hypothetical protein
MTPKIRFNPSASKASRPASRTPLRIASAKKMSSWQSMLNHSKLPPHASPRDGRIVAARDRLPQIPM